MAGRNPAPAHDERRRHFAQGMGGIPVIGGPDHVAAEIGRVAEAGLRGIGVSFVNHAEEPPASCDEELPRLERMGLRDAAG